MRRGKSFSPGEILEYSKYQNCIKSFPLANLEDVYLAARLERVGTREEHHPSRKETDFYTGFSDPSAMRLGINC